MVFVRLEYRMVALVLCGIVLVLLPSPAFACPQVRSSTGVPEVSKVRLPEAVDAGQPVTVTIRVKGSSGEVLQPVPFDGVLLIDQSDSMSTSDPQDKRIDAAESFVDCVASTTRLGIVPYGSSASVAQGLTSDKALLRSTLESLRGHYQGSTDMYGAMSQAQTLLTGNGQSDRQWFAILLTDGWDNSGHTDADFEVKAEDAKNHGIIYYNVALGSGASLGLLYMIADITGGQQFYSPDAGSLANLYATICQQTSFRTNTRNIVLDEKLNTSGQPPVHVVPGSVSTGIPGVTAPQIQQFEQTGHITAAIGTLGDGQETTFSFQVASDCLRPDAAPGAEVATNIDDPASAVQYTFGLSQGNKSLPQWDFVQDSFICRTPGDLSVDKSFDPAKMELKLTVKNNWLPDPTGAHDNSLRNIAIVEQPSFFFQPKRGSSVPTETWFFAAADTDFLVWQIPKLGPKESAEFKTTLEATLCSAQNKPPLDVDAEKYTGSGPNSYVYYNPPAGEQRRTIIRNKTTTLSQVETCQGRYDLALEPAYSIGEYRNELTNTSPLRPWNVSYVHPRDESSMVFVDSAYGNGLWDGNPDTISQFIKGATDVTHIQGQGDPLKMGVRNLIYVRVSNTGTLTSPRLDHGLSLHVFDRVARTWREISTVPVPAVPPRRHTFVSIPLPMSIFSPRYFVPYMLSLKDILVLVRTESPSFANHMDAWLNAHASVREALSSAGKLGPDQIRTYLAADAPMLADFNNFMSQHPQISWGKRSINVQASLHPNATEKHTNNNSTSEVIIVSQ